MPMRTAKETAMLETGIKNTITKTVTPEYTAKALGSGLLNVFSTPMLTAFMEEAAHTMVAPFLEDGCSTVGISMELKHTAPTPVGMTVTVTATLTEIDRKKLTFSITARDEKGDIGSAVHKRFIVNSEEFEKKAYNK